MCCLESMVRFKAPYSYSVFMCCIWAKSQHTKKNLLKLLYKIFQGPMKVDQLLYGEIFLCLSA